jgi:uncharacterized phage-associated protein
MEERITVIMADVFDVASYILAKKGHMSTMKLQKLVYYSQAWSLVWDEKPIFTEPIQAWRDGPVVRDLYNVHRGEFTLSKINRGNPKKLSDSEKETIDAVLDAYGEYDGATLSRMSHDEYPWRLARGSTPDGEICDIEITRDSMREFYASL